MANQDYPEKRLSPWFGVNRPPVRHGLYRLRMPGLRTKIDGWYADGESANVLMIPGIIQPL